MARRLLRNTRGISLLEVIVALTILSTVLVSLSGIMWQMGRRTQLSGTAAFRTAAVEGGAATALSVPWDSIGAIVGCAGDTSGTLTYTRCFSVTDVSDGLKQIRVVIAPTNALTLRPETLAVYRTQPLLPNPLHVP